MNDTKLVNALRCNPKIHALEEVGWICLKTLDKPLDLLLPINHTILDIDESIKCKNDLRKKSLWAGGVFFGLTRIL